MNETMIQRREMIITGASGFLGYTLLTELAPYFSITACIHTHPLQCEAAHTIHLNLGSDVTELDALCASISADSNPPVIIHSAAISTVRECANDPKLAHSINTEATARIAEIAARYECPLFFLSTDLLYNDGTPPFSEEHARANSVYTQSKLSGEEAALAIHPASIILRCALMIGPDTEVAPSHIRKMDRAIQTGQMLNLFTDEFRTPLWTPDIAIVIRRVIEKGINGRIYNLGGPDRVSRYQLGIIAATILNWPTNRIIPTLFDSMPQAGNRSKDCSLDTTRARTELGITFTPLITGLQLLVNHWQKNG